MMMIADLYDDRSRRMHTPPLQGLVDSWIDFVAHEIELPATLWLYPVLGYLAHNPAVTEKAKSDLAKGLKVRPLGDDGSLQRSMMLIMSIPC